VENVINMGERYPNSPGWRAQLDYICEAIVSLGLEPEVEKWHDEVEGLDFENVSVTLPGRSNRRIVLGVHHDTKRFSGHPDPGDNFHFLGANDGGSGVGLLLALIETLRGHEQEATLQFVFFDGEESITVDWNNAERALYGSRKFVQTENDRTETSLPDLVCAVIILDMVGYKDLQIDDDEHSDGELRRIFRRAVLDQGYKEHFFRQRTPIQDDHLPFVETGIPAIDLIQKSINPYWHTPEDTIDKMCATSLQKVGAVVLCALPTVANNFV
jgi:glutaminyl-peptide cyclotransferase